MIPGDTFGDLPGDVGLPGGDPRSGGFTKGGDVVYLNVEEIRVVDSRDPERTAQAVLGAIQREALRGGPDPTKVFAR